MIADVAMSFLFFVIIISIVAFLIGLIEISNDYRVFPKYLPVIVGFISIVISILTMFYINSCYNAIPPKETAIKAMKINDGGYMLIYNKKPYYTNKEDVVIQQRKGWYGGLYFDDVVIK